MKYQVLPPLPELPPMPEDICLSYPGGKFIWPGTRINELVEIKLIKDEATDRFFVRTISRPPEGATLFT